MKRTLYISLLAVEAVACVVFCIANISSADIFATAVAFPFKQIGAALRALSLFHPLTNIAAIAIYVLFCLLPVGALFLIKKRRPLKQEDWLLAVLSAVLFGVLYLMINPGLMPQLLGAAAAPPIAGVVLGSLVYSLLIGYLVIRVLRLFSAGDAPQLERYISLMLGGLNVLFVFMAFGSCFSQLLTSVLALQAGNTGNEQMLGVSYFFLILQYAVNALPYLLNIVIVFAALRLLNAMQKDRYSAQTIAASKQISALCTKALVAIILSNIGFNLLQIICARFSMVVNTSLQIPLMSILFVLASLLLTRYVIQNKQLKEENDQYI